jgi:competence protein ComEA
MSLNIRDRAALLLVALCLVLVGASSWILLAAAGGETPAAALPSFGIPEISAAPDPESAAGGDLVVDVEGAVARPGVVSLPGDARVADAIVAVGGYAPDADLAAAAKSLNLAARLSDGAQVYVPVIGAPEEPGSSPDGGAAADGGLVNLNTASLDELEALPGIGPVTAQKIVAARTGQPFSTLDELVDRKVMNRGQLDGIRDLVTV